MSMNQICPICSYEFEAGQILKQLNCHKTHLMHDACLQHMMNFMKEKGQTPSCPICRLTIQENLIKPIKINLDEIVEEDAFGGYPLDPI